MESNYNQDYTISAETEHCHVHVQLQKGRLSITVPPFPYRDFIPPQFIVERRPPSPSVFVLLDRGNIVK